MKSVKESDEAYSARLISHSIDQVGMLACALYSYSHDMKFAWVISSILFVFAMIAPVLHRENKQ